METFGADFSTTHPSPAVLKQNGWSFVVGYISRNSAKCLTDWRSYMDAGLGVAFVFEDAALPNYGNGAADAAFCNTWMTQHGVPLTSPLFVAFDSDAVDIAAAGSYMRAFSAATPALTGPYGKFSLIEALVTPGQIPCPIGWQTAAWSAGQLSQKANLYQRATHNHPLPGYAPTSYDENVLTKPMPFLTTIGPTDMQLSDQVPFTAPNDDPLVLAAPGTTSNFTVGDYLTWTNYWAQRALVEVQKLRADLASGAIAVNVTVNGKTV